MIKLFQTILFAIILFMSSSCQQNKQVAPLKPEMEENFEFNEIKERLEDIGEQAVTDTNKYSKFIYLNHSYLNHNSIICIKNFKGDSLSIVSLVYFDQDVILYSPNDTDAKGLIKNYPYIQNLKKVTGKQNLKKSTQIFNYFTSLINNRHLKPFGEETRKHNERDIVDGRDQIFLFDGKHFYNKYPNQKEMDSVYKLFERNIDFKDLIGKLNNLVIP